MENIQQIRSAHRKAVAEGSRLSLKTFAKECSARDGVDYNEVIKVAHQRASKSRSEAKMLRTRAAIAAKNVKKNK